MIAESEDFLERVDGLLAELGKGLATIRSLASFLYVFGFEWYMLIRSLDDPFGDELFESLLVNRWVFCEVILYSADSGHIIDWSKSSAPCFILFPMTDEQQIIWWSRSEINSSNNCYLSVPIRVQSPYSLC